MSNLINSSVIEGQIRQELILLQGINHIFGTKTPIDICFSNLLQNSWVLQGVTQTVIDKCYLQLFWLFLKWVPIFQVIELCCLKIFWGASTLRGWDV